VLQLVFSRADSADPAAILEATEFWVTGGALWNQVEHGLIASYCTGAWWKYRGRYYTTISILGESRLVFGITRDPSLISDPVQMLSITGTTFRANDIVFAEYDEHQDAWQGVVRPVSWRAMRVISAEAAPHLVNDARFNPWNERSAVIPVVHGPVPADGPAPLAAGPSGRASEASGCGPTGITPEVALRRRE
jgi:hypothetical protein